MYCSSLKRRRFPTASDHKAPLVEVGNVSPAFSTACLKRCTSAPTTPRTTCRVGGTSASIGRSNLISSQGSPVPESLPPRARVSIVRQFGCLAKLFCRCDHSSPSPEEESVELGADSSDVLLPHEETFSESGELPSSARSKKSERSKTSACSWGSASSIEAAKLPGSMEVPMPGALGSFFAAEASSQGLHWHGTGAPATRRAAISTHELRSSRSSRILLEHERTSALSSSEHSR
mmetsp:Transcript_126624/g.224272  ORF Transcript_126624/g.224272 Transcript_126624/m.224272 type:complete len:234 (-) Transcript_126624:72-773(-)